MEDLCQDVFLMVKKKASQYNEKGKLKAWLYSVAARTARGRRRKLAIRGRLLGMFSGKPLAMGSANQASPEVGAMFNVDLARILGDLPQVERQILVLFEHDGLKGEEIAQLLDMNLNTVWTKLRRARAAVVQAVEAQTIR